MIRQVRKKSIIGSSILCIIIATVVAYSLVSPPATGQGRRKQMTVEEIVEQAESLSAKEMAELIRSLRELLNEKLLGIDPTLASKFESIEEEEKIRVNRLLERGLFDDLLGGRGGGAYFSFTTLVNDYNREPHLGLAQWKLQSGFAGSDFGLIERIGNVPIRKVKLAQVPDYLLEEDLEVLGVHRKPQQSEVRIDQTYLVRAVDYGTADLLVALQVLERDPYGITFAWKIVKEFETPRR